MSYIDLDHCDANQRAISLASLTNHRKRPPCTRQWTICSPRSSADPQLQITGESATVPFQRIKHARDLTTCPPRFSSRKERRVHCLCMRWARAGCVDHLNSRAMKVRVARRAAREDDSDETVEVGAAADHNACVLVRIESCCQRASSRHHDYFLRTSECDNESHG